MTRTIHQSEHTNGAGEAVYVLTVYCASRPERDAVKVAALSVPTPAAFQPLPKPGDPFDAYEGPPPNCDGNRQFADASAVLAHAQHEAALDGEGCDSVACSITRGVND